VSAETQQPSPVSFAEDCTLVCQALHLSGDKVDPTGATWCKKRGFGAGDGSNGRVLVYQTQGPQFKPKRKQTDKQTKKKKKKEKEKRKLRVITRSNDFGKGKQLPPDSVTSSTEARGGTRLIKNRAHLKKAIEPGRNRAGVCVFGREDTQCYKNSSF
jgi:hypothetical protein